MVFDETRVKSLRADDRYASAMGVRIVEVNDDTLVLELDVEGRHTNFYEMGHGGMVFSLADCALSLASNSDHQKALAVDAHIALTAPARPGDTLIASISRVSASSKLATYSVTVSRDDDVVCASFTGTTYIATP